ncbi:Serine/threonine kinase [Rhizoclosmatium hyalinum]|nr:Serine/threonine kinase [Rhizoclosmatium hyalinum]
MVPNFCQLKPEMAIQLVAAFEDAERKKHAKEMEEAEKAEKVRREHDAAVASALATTVNAADLFRDKEPEGETYLRDKLLENAKQLELLHLQQQREQQDAQQQRAAEEERRRRQAEDDERRKQFELQQRRLLEERRRQAELEEQRRQQQQQVGFASRNVKLEDFDFLAVLGRGAFGKVMLIEEKSTKQLYAMKALKKEFIIQSDDVASAMLEKRIFQKATQSQHPFLVNLHSCFQSDTRLYFVMEYISGGDLMCHIQEKKRFSQVRAKFYACEVLLALDFFHKNNIIYRDLKLDNIVMCPDGHIKVIDYGICKENMPYGQLTRTYCGTPDYMAPEILNQSKYSRAVDWWSFGVLIYVMLVGRVECPNIQSFITNNVLKQYPFHGDDESDILEAIVSDAIEYPSNMPKETLGLIQGLLKKDPRSRLGGGKLDAEEVKRHPYFAGVDWDLFMEKKVAPPWKPVIKSERDVSNFDAEFTKEKPILTPVNTVLSAVHQAEFKEFDFTAEWAGQLLAANDQIHFKYFFGKGFSPDIAYQISLEQQMYPSDTVVTERYEDRDDGKILDWFRYARSELYYEVEDGEWCSRYKFIGKGDDDGVIHVGRLSTMLKGIPDHESSYIGRLSYPNVRGQHMTGMLSLVTPDIVEWINESPFPAENKDGVEDMVLGTWFWDMNLEIKLVKIENEFHNLPDGPYFQKRISNESVVVHFCKNNYQFFQCMRGLYNPIEERIDSLHYLVHPEIIDYRVKYQFGLNITNDTVEDIYAQLYYTTKNSTISIQEYDDILLDSSIDTAFDQLGLNEVGKDNEFRTQVSYRLREASYDSWLLGADTLQLIIETFLRRRLNEMGLTEIEHIMFSSSRMATLVSWVKQDSERAMSVIDFVVLKDYIITRAQARKKLFFTEDASANIAQSLLKLINDEERVNEAIVDEEIMRFLPNKRLHYQNTYTMKFTIASVLLSSIGVLNSFTLAANQLPNGMLDLPSCSTNCISQQIGPYNAASWANSLCTKTFVEKKYSDCIKTNCKTDREANPAVAFIKKQKSYCDALKSGKPAKTGVKPSKTHTAKAGKTVAHPKNTNTAAKVKPSKTGV